MCIETLGLRIARLREQAGLSQVRLARRAGVCLKSLANWEQDAHEPRARAVAMLARAMGVTADELLGIAGAPPLQFPPEPPSRPRGRPRKRRRMAG